MIEFNNNNNKEIQIVRQLKPNLEIFNPNQIRLLGKWMHFRKFSWLNLKEKLHFSMGKKTNWF